jgi:hypothetical protein
MSNTLTGEPVLGTLARQEIRNYLRHKLVWFGAALWAALCVSAFVASSEDYATTGDGLGSALVLGVFGIVIMAGLVRNSDRAAHAAGAVAVPQRVRTLALAAAVVVPGSMALVWFASAVAGYQLDPPSPAGAPFGDHSETDFFAAMFAEGVTPAIGGPLLGLVIGRWLPGRGAAPLLAVVVVILTVVMQPLFGWAEKPRLGWIWIHFYGLGGVEGDSDRLVAYPGSPYLYIGYQLTLCLLGVLVAMYADPDADRPALRRRVFAVLGIAVLVSALSFAVGPHDTEPSPVPSPNASEG